ncbi:ABC Fe3+-siderophores transporter, periplasmic binding protein [Roseobacter sp. MED193]|uniref:ABC transporter substrate-binding protein n=1 Tax=Roseobacter sp. MED193 TaxID=314262 RepID=UPI000068B9C9|nr:ABC transporter substrate-binding protein [Roseobacter sp. MED193]EAQ47213.1 ABC Fe3+-siderophores transporter, periplasmic binding protein [Roseobacter sp. MED193]
MKNGLIASGVLTLVLMSSVVNAQQTEYPLTVSNCGFDQTFDAAPNATVTVGQSTTELLYLLGLGEKVAGTSVWFNPVLPQFAGLNAGIERLADNDPSFESVVNKKPDLVTVMYEWHVGAEGIVATRNMFHDVGVPTYVMPTDCESKDNLVGGDGTRSELFSTEQLYKAISQLSLIYDVQSNGVELIESLKASEADAIAQAQALNLPTGTSALFWFSSADMEADPYVAGRQGVPAYMMDKLGVDNVVTSDEEWPLVGWETLAKADPSFIVIAEMNRRRFPADDVEMKRQFLMNDPVASEMTAVKEGRIITIGAHAMSPTVRAIYALGQVAEALEGYNLK